MNLWHMKYVFIAALFIFVLLTACGEKSVHYGPYAIGRDETWYPLQLGTQGENLTAFSTAVVQEIAKSEQIPLQLLNISWGQLLDALNKGEVGGVLTSLKPDTVSTHEYVFSNPLISLGPVLIVPKTSEATKLEDMNDKIVGVYQFDQSVLLVQQYPAIVIKSYQNKPSALEELVEGKIDGVLMSILDAQALVPYIFPDQLKIVTPPLDDAGIRLITLKDRHSSLTKYFNRGLKKMHTSGSYDTLRLNYQL